MKTKIFFRISILAICFVFCGNSVMGKDTTIRFTWKNYFTATYNQNVITKNRALGDYSYTSPKPHALTEVELSDSNSISLNQCDLSYTAFNKVKTINEGDYNYEIKYFPNQQRAITILKENGTVTEKKIYTDKTFEQTDDKKYFYIYAYGQPIAVFIQEGNNNIRPYFIYTDHLGSIDKITDGNGNVVDSMSFDPWGNRRNPWYWAMKESNTTHLIDRGFTGHQHLDVFELINMNGRMFDPVVQQFLSPDPYVQMPDNPLNFNRYAYCLFNPLKYIDPSGMLFGDYRDRFNNYLGNDGINDGKVYIVTDAIDVAKIQLNNIFHKTTPLSEVRSAIDLQISQDLRWEILSKSITFDTPENLQEWGGVARQHQLEDGSLYDYINWGERGPVWQGNPHNAYFFFSTARGKGQGLVFFHLHFQGRKDGIRAIQTPSEIDFNNVREDPARRNALNLVISVQDNAVHIMHNNNTWTTMSFGSFWGAKNIYTPKQY